jgi:hypothetical protein
VVQAVKQTIALPAGSFSRLMLLATAVNGSQSDLAFTVRYTDGTSTTRRQSFSDWTSPPHHPGESVALSMRYRNKKNGAKDNRATYVYGYVFNLDTSKLVASITLPYNRNLNLLAIDLAP